MRTGDIEITLGRILQENTSPQPRNMQAAWCFINKQIRFRHLNLMSLSLQFSKKHRRLFYRCHYMRQLFTVENPRSTAILVRTKSLWFLRALIANSYSIALRNAPNLILTRSEYANSCNRTF